MIFPSTLLSPCYISKDPPPPQKKVRIVFLKTCRGDKTHVFVIYKKKPQHFLVVLKKKKNPIRNRI